jgi:hypothetical protein
LGEKHVSSATGFLQRTLIKFVALRLPLKWPKGFPTRPEVEQGEGGSVPIEFNEDRRRLISTVNRFGGHLPEPCAHHPSFGPMTSKDWQRWGYLHADHHLRQFGG